MTLDAPILLAVACILLAVAIILALANAGLRRRLEAVAADVSTWKQAAERSQAQFKALSATAFRLETDHSRKAYFYDTVKKALADAADPPPPDAG